MTLMLPRSTFMYFWLFAAKCVRIVDIVAGCWLKKNKQFLLLEGCNLGDSEIVQLKHASAVTRSMSRDVLVFIVIQIQNLSFGIFLKPPKDWSYRNEKFKLFQMFFPNCAFVFQIVCLFHIFIEVFLNFGCEISSLRRNCVHSSCWFCVGISLFWFHSFIHIFLFHTDTNTDSNRITLKTFEQQIENVL